MTCPACGTTADSIMSIENGVILIVTAKYHRIWERLERIKRALACLRKGDVPVDFMLWYLPQQSRICYARMSEGGGWVGEYAEDAITVRRGSREELKMYRTSRDIRAGVGA